VSAGPARSLDSADSDVFASKSQAHVHRFVNVLLHFQTAHVPRPNVYCTAVYGLRVQGTELSVWVCDGTVAGTSTCSGTWVRSLVVPVPNRWCRAPRSGLTLLAAMCVPYFRRVALVSRAEGHPRHLILDGKSA
jgi:hypothetical protein